MHCLRIHIECTRLLKISLLQCSQQLSHHSRMMNNSFWFWSLRWSCVRYRVDVECKYYCNFKWKIFWCVIVSMLWGLCEDMNMKWLTALTKTQQTIELAYTNELWSKSNLLWYHYGSNILSRLNGDVHELLCGNLCVLSSSVCQEKWKRVAARVKTVSGFIAYLQRYPDTQRDQTTAVSSQNEIQPLIAAHEGESGKKKSFLLAMFHL